VAGDLPRALARVRGPIGLIVMDPPYADASALDVATEAAAAPWLGPDAILALEHGARGGAAPGILGSLARQRSRRHGDSVLTLYARGRFDRAQGGSEDSAVSGDV
jgi:16S rRNA G966 N2-methylase RsmD